jgi:hypothetical protein
MIIILQSLIIRLEYTVYAWHAAGNSDAEFPDISILLQA